VISDCQGKFLKRDASFVKEFHEKLSSMGNLKFMGIIFSPHLIAGRACENDLFHSFFPKGFKVVVSELMKQLSYSCAKQGKSATPLFFTKQCKVHLAHIQYFSQGHGNLLGQREIGSNATCEICHFRLILDIAMVRGMAHVFHPICPLFIVFGKDVSAFFQIVPDHVDLFGIEPGMDHVLPKRKPQVLEVDAYGADFLAIST
jgi:hypothetical protein